MPHLSRLLCLAAAAVALAGCSDQAAPPRPATLVRTETVQMQARQVSVALTGDIQASRNMVDRGQAVRSKHNTDQYDEGGGNTQQRNMCRTFVCY